MAINVAPRPAAMPDLQRKDLWWVQPVAVAVALGVFLIYGTVRAFENNLFETTRNAAATAFADGVVPHYLSPFYSPPLHHLPFWPAALSPALFLLAFPGSFRASCYFCRRSYYRAFFWDPPACAVREIRQKARKNYTGESRFPLNLQNLHRYTLYPIFVFVAFHWYHLLEAFTFSAGGQSRLGVGLGTLVFGLDTLFLTLYVVSCHSFRHLVGGGVNEYSKNSFAARLWNLVTPLNERHGLFFWLSLFSVGLADVYVRLVCSGAVQDVHLLF